MSFGKSIEGIALSSTLYSADIDTFATRLAHALGVNISVFHYYLMENEDDESWKQENIYDFGYATSCRLTVDRNEPTDNFYYDLNLPVDFPNEEELFVQFLDNGIIEFQFLTYDHHWRWFMEKLYQTCVSLEEDKSILNDVLRTKDLVEQLLHQLGLDRIICYGDYPYNFFDDIIHKKAKIDNFQQILSVVKNLDGLAIADFDSLLTGKLMSNFPYEWLDQKPDKVVLLHRLNQLHSI